MIYYLRHLLALALLLMPLSEASAASGVTQITVKDAAGTTRNINVTSDTGAITGNLVWNNNICDFTTPLNCAAVKAGNTAAVGDLALIVSDPNLLAAVQASVPAGTSRIGYTSDDPCTQLVKLGAPINLTGSGQVITGTAAQKISICSIDLISATAQNIALVEGTGSVCATNIFGLAGGTTAPTGWNLAANGGLTKGSGTGTVYSPSADANATAANVCLLLSGSGQTSGQITYVKN